MDGKAAGCKVAGEVAGERAGPGTGEGTGAEGAGAEKEKWRREKDSESSQPVETLGGGIPQEAWPGGLGTMGAGQTATMGAGKAAAMGAGGPQTLGKTAGFEAKTSCTEVRNILV